MQALLLVAEPDGPAMFARIGVMKALNRHVERVFDPSRKVRNWNLMTSRGWADRAFKKVTRGNEGTKSRK
jgi:hypothetical protein